MGKVFAVGVGPGSHDCVTEIVGKTVPATPALMNSRLSIFTRPVDFG